MHCISQQYVYYLGAALQYFVPNTVEAFHFGNHTFQRFIYLCVAHDYLELYRLL